MEPMTNLSYVSLPTVLRPDMASKRVDWEEEWEVWGGEKRGRISTGSSKRTHPVGGSERPFKRAHANPHAARQLRPSRQQTRPGSHLASAGWSHERGLVGGGGGGTDEEAARSPEGGVSQGLTSQNLTSKNRVKLERPQAVNGGQGDHQTRRAHRPRTRQEPRMKGRGAGRRDRKG